MLVKMALNNPIQKHFHFEPISEESPEYFIMHSGVMESYQKALQVIEGGLLDGGLLYVYGPKGCGKTHFCEVLLSRARALNLPFRYLRLEGDKIFTGDRVEIDASAFISAYQELKGQSGLLVVEGDEFPNHESEFSESVRPHVLSRLLSGELLKLDNPQEEELRPVLMALLERHHLRLKSSQLDLILSRVPAVPDYFRIISEALTELLPNVGKLKVSVLKNYLEERRV